MYFSLQWIVHYLTNVYLHLSAKTNRTKQQAYTHALVTLYLTRVRRPTSVMRRSNLGLSSRISLPIHYQFVAIWFLYRLFDSRSWNSVCNRFINSRDSIWEVDSNVNCNAAVGYIHADSYYFARESGCKVLWGVRLSVCLSVCLSVLQDCQDISRTSRAIFTNFCACCLRLWLGPPLARWR